MDRLRWLSNDGGQNYIFVNVADFSLEVMEDEQPVMSMRIIAGKDEQRSCVLSAKMTYLELNPFWRVPDSIAAKEILPQVKKDPVYLAQKTIKVFKDWSDNAKEIDPVLINWSRIRASNLGYKFRQEPGPLNPLGRIKFIFPNECEIYLHDTPTRHLFGRTRRDFSHGCIRVEKPVELATYLLRKKESWIQKKILAEIKKGKRQVVMLPEPVKVHIFYGTVWVDREGVLQFRNDIYHADEISYDLPLKRGRVAGVTR
jgi:murein L,D-transpeptidase YcbB/YkuD